MSEIIYGFSSRIVCNIKHAVVLKSFPSWAFFSENKPHRYFFSTHLQFFINDGYKKDPNDWSNSVCVAPSNINDSLKSFVVVVAETLYFLRRSSCPFFLAKSLQFLLLPGLSSMNCTLQISSDWLNDIDVSRLSWPLQNRHSVANDRSTLPCAVDRCHVWTSKDLLITSCLNLSFYSDQLLPPCCTVGTVFLSS